MKGQRARSRGETGAKGGPEEKGSEGRREVEESGLFSPKKIKKQLNEAGSE